MRFVLCFCFLIFAHPSTLLAGTLSRARGAVRNQPPASHSEPSNHSNDDSDDDRPTGRLAQARSEVRQHQGRGHSDPSHGGGPRSGGSYLRPPRRVHGGGAFGFFAFDRCEPRCPPPCCPPPVIETYVTTPAYVVAPQPVYQPRPEPIAPTLAETVFRQFAPYPYAQGCDGLMLTGSPGAGKPWMGQLQLEGGSDFDAIDRTGLGLLVESAGGLGLEFGWDAYTEDLPSGGHDELHIGELGVLYRVAETDRALVRVGLGTAWMGDRYDTDFGLNLSVRADYAPSDPFILSGELDLGRLGDAEHLHAAGTVGVTLDRCELYGGYDYRRIGDVEISGPMVGLRLWF